MKKILLSLAGVFLSLGAFAQSNLHLNYNVVNPEISGLKVMYEGGSFTENSITYALISADFSSATGLDYTYIQLFQEFKFWEKPIYIHVEARTSNFDLNSVYLGGTFCIDTPNGVVMIEPMYANEMLRYNWDWKSSKFMVSFVSEHDWGWMNINGFTDIWTGNNLSDAGLYSELWIYFPIYKNIELGGIVTFSAIGGIPASAGAYPGLKIKF